MTKVIKYVQTGNWTEVTVLVGLLATALCYFIPSTCAVVGKVQPTVAVLAPTFAGIGFLKALLK